MPNKKRHAPSFKITRFSKALGLAVRRIREDRGMSQASLAKRAKVSRAQICNLERGRTTGSVEVLVRMCNALKCSYEEILPEEVRGAK